MNKLTPPLAISPWHRGQRACVALVSLALLLGSGVAAATDAINGKSAGHVIALIDAGHFNATAASITHALAQPTVPADIRSALLFQRERMRRILLDFILSADIEWKILPDKNTTE